MLLHMESRRDSFLIFAFIFLGIIAINKCDAQDSITCNDYQGIVYKGDTTTIPCNKMVLMDVETFADYWHSKNQLEELRNEVPEWTSVVDSISQVHNENRVELDSIIDLKSDQIHFYKKNQEELLRSLYYCDRDRKSLYKKNKRNRKISLGSIGINGILLLILL